MGRLKDMLFGSSSTKKDNYGFTACGSCATTHNSGCRDIDAELLERYPQLKAMQGQPDFERKLAGVRKIAFGETPSPNG